MKIKGTKKNDVLIGTNGDDVIKGGKGADVIDGRNGADKLFGGKGADVFLFRSDQVGVDTIKDFEPGKDRIIVKGQDPNQAILYQDGDVYTVTFHGGGYGDITIGSPFVIIEEAPELQYARDLIHV